VTLSNVCHAAELCRPDLDNVWYGSDTVVEEWFGKFLQTTNVVKSFKRNRAMRDDTAEAEEAVGEYFTSWKVTA